MRLSFIQQQLDVTEKKIIDIGCGGGLLAEGLAREGAHVTGIDLAESAIKTAKTHAHVSHLTIDYQVISAEDFAKQHAQQFDVVTCMELLEHVPDPLSVIRACSDLVKPGGYVFFSTINRNPKAYLFAIVGAEWLLQLLPKGTHDYAKFIRPSELSQWSRQTNLYLKKMSGITYHPLSKHYTLTNDVSVNYLLSCEKQ